MWLPQERILFSGDLVEYAATPYTGDAYLTDWPATLDAIAALQPEKLVPGRGASLTNPAEVKAGADQLPQDLNSRRSQQHWFRSRAVPTTWRRRRNWWSRASDGRANPLLRHLRRQLVHRTRKLCTTLAVVSMPVHARVVIRQMGRVLSMLLRPLPARGMSPGAAKSSSAS